MLVLLRVHGLRVGRAVVVASHHILLVRAHASPIIGAALVELGLFGIQAVRNDPVTSVRSIAFGFEVRFGTHWSTAEPHPEEDAELLAAAGADETAVEEDCAAARPAAATTKATVKCIAVDLIGEDVLCENVI